jgi:lysophospholipase L1-like esterase
MLAAKRQPAVRLIFDGDSITDHWQTVGKAQWDAHFAEAFDFGIGGDRTEHLLWRLAHGQVDKLNPRLIVLMIGTNNLYRDTDAQIAEGVETIVREYQRRCPTAAILLQGILPRGEKPSDPFRARIQHINTLLARLADGKRVLYLDFGEKLLEPDGTISRDMMPDFLHPSAAAYAIWAAEIAPVIGKFFGGA